MQKALIVALIVSIAGVAGAQSLSEDFTNVPGLFSAGWLNVNNSVLASGQAWLQGDATNWFAGTAGAGDASYALADYGSTGATGATGGTLSVWMLTPVMTFVNGSTIQFQTKSAGGFADRMQVLLGSNGSDSNVGILPEDVGTYGKLLLDINPAESATAYPTAWTQESLTVSGLSGPTSTRLAFRYYVHDGGGAGNNSNGIGVDILRVGAPVPEPATLTALALGAIALIRRRRKN